MATQQDATSYSEPIHESAFVLGMRVVILQLSVGLLSVLANVTVFYLAKALGSDAGVITVLSIGNILIQTLDALILIYLVLQWLRTSYIIRPDEIVVNRGIRNVKTTVYKTNNIEAVEISRPFLGKIFKYGTIKFRNPTLGEDVYITNIPDPNRYADIIK
jgi:uncharacterized membrane protein YdbT with pleckstrin-like domain